jgi:hypothetical protein
MKRFALKRGALVVLALAAVVGVVTGREKPAVELMEAKAPRSEPSVAALDINLDKLHRPETGAPLNDPFARNSFAPAPAPQQQEAAAPPPAPSAPALPFRYFGKLIEKGKTEVYVMRGDELISIAAGSQLDNEYRVEGISDTAIEFTYLPLKTRQSMELPG